MSVPSSDVRSSGLRSLVRSWRRAAKDRIDWLGYEVDYLRSRSVETRSSDLKSICLALGPYRNLTTLTAGILFLHPTCQVLNHGAGRILPIGQANFLRGYSERRFDNFVRLAIYLSQGGRRGRYGGSITLAHAFEHDVIRRLYRERYGESLVKPHIESLFWKESLLIANFIREHGVDLADLLSRNDRLRFLMPIRNPLDCAVSNHKTGHSKYFSGLGEGSREEILDRILDEIAWFLDLRAEHPDRFFCFFEDEFDEQVLRDLASFLRIEPDAAWIRDALESYQLKKSYDHAPAFVDHYQRSLDARLGAHPTVRARLTGFALRG